jgi:hypothetical protein
MVEGKRWRVCNVKPLAQLPPVIGLREGISQDEIAKVIGVSKERLVEFGITQFSINREKLHETLTTELTKGKRGMLNNFKLRRGEKRSADNAAQAIIGRFGTEQAVLELNTNKAFWYLKNNFDGIKDRGKIYDAIYAMSHEDSSPRQIKNVIAITQMLYQYKEGDPDEISTMAKIAGRVGVYQQIAERLGAERGFSIKGTELEKVIRHEQLVWSLTRPVEKD